MPVVKMRTEAKNFIVRLTPEKPNKNKEEEREKQNFSCSGNEFDRQVVFIIKILVSI